MGKPKTVCAAVVQGNSLVHKETPARQWNGPAEKREFQKADHLETKWSSFGMTIFALASFFRNQQQTVLEEGNQS